MTRRKGGTASEVEAPEVEAPEAPAPEAPKVPDGVPLSDGCYITDVRVYLLKTPVGNLVANAQILIGGVFLVKDVRVLNGANGYFIGFPSKKKRDGDGYEDVANPITAEARAMLTALILEKYQAALDKESGL